uniref:Uncharacterized protein n=1 Tax=Anguilla anguilla TaxID=7936 RepID=A0A0E9U9T4_ANGAN
MPVTFGLVKCPVTLQSAISNTISLID